MLETRALHPPPEGVEGVDEHPGGVCVLSGDALALFEAIDAALRRLSLGWPAGEILVPPFIPAADLDRYGYFASFPHLATLPATFDAGALERAERLPGIDARGIVSGPPLAPPRNVLTPAACYHVYRRYEGRALEGPRFSAIRGWCFRNEATSRPLVRQRAFTMRELVCIGRPAEVEAFLAEGRAEVSRLLEALGIDHAWRDASDPFFRPERSSKHLMQQIAPSKREAEAGGVAVASTNLHRTFFGSIHGITVDGEPASSGCLAFGLERWLDAVVRAHGPDPASWGGAVETLGRFRRAAPC